MLPGGMQNAGLKLGSAEMLLYTGEYDKNFGIITVTCHKMV